MFLPSLSGLEEQDFSGLNGSPVLIGWKPITRIQVIQVLFMPVSITKQCLFLIQGYIEEDEKLILAIEF